MQYPSNGSFDKVIFLQACTQFNLLAGEGRMVAAALIPPCSVRDGDSDMYDTLSLDNKLFTIDNLHSEDLAPLKNTKK